MLNSIRQKYFRFEGNLTTDAKSTYTNTQFELEADSPIVADTWYHLAMLMDRDTKQLCAWVDGQELTTTIRGTAIADGPIYNSHKPLVVFDSTNLAVSGKYTPLTIDEVRIYHKTLSAAEVHNLHDNSANPE